MTNSVEELKDRLKDEGYKLTTQRKIIYDVFINHNDKHLSPEEVYEFVRDEHPEIGLATVYRTLQLFEDIKFLNRLNFNDGCSRYELTEEDSEGHHYHIVCTKCGKITEIDDLDISDIQKIMKNDNEHKVEEYSIKFFGVCEDCLAKN